MKFKIPGGLPSISVEFCHSHDHWENVCLIGGICRMCDPELFCSVHKTTLLDIPLTCDCGWGIETPRANFSAGQTCARTSCNARLELRCPKCSALVMMCPEA